MEESRNNPTMEAAQAEETLAAEAGQAVAEAGEPAGERPDGESRTFTQAEVDRMIRQRLARAQRDTEARLEAARAEGRDEAERLGRMTDQERLAHERAQAEQAAQRREAELSAREAAISRRELRADALGLLAERQLPGELEQLLNYADRDAMIRGIDSLETVFRRAVQDGIDARLRQNGIRLSVGAGPRDASGMDDAAYYASLGR